MWQISEEVGCGSEGWSWWSRPSFANWDRSQEKQAKGVRLMAREEQNATNKDTLRRMANELEVKALAFLWPLLLLLLRCPRFRSR